MKQKEESTMSPLIRSDEYPDIDLYMDQVITFMEKKYPGRVLTKTMINNYTKDRILTPPVKKKYSKEHLMLLTLLQVLKGTQSLPEIKKILFPISQELGKGNREPLYALYDSFYDLHTEILSLILKTQDDLYTLTPDPGLRVLSMALIAGYFKDASSELLDL
jgi:hypothetical protein